MAQSNFDDWSSLSGGRDHFDFNNDGKIDDIEGNALVTDVSEQLEDFEARVGSGKDGKSPAKAAAQNAATTNTARIDKLLLLAALIYVICIFTCDMSSLASWLLLLPIVLGCMIRIYQEKKKERDA